MTGRVVGTLCQLLGIVSAAIALLCGLMFSFLYWPYRRLFDEEGRYFDANTAVVYHSESGVLIVPTVLFGILAVFLVFIGWRLLRKGRGSLRVVSRSQHNP